MPLAIDSNADEITEPPSTKYCYALVVDRICTFRWQEASGTELLRTAQAYYYFSVQFRENLEIACSLYPHDAKLRLLHREECQTDNLSPWPCIAAAGEKLDHDEFMRRALLLNPGSRSRELDRVGLHYLSTVRAQDWLSRAKSISSYEDDGLSRVFSAILRARDWHDPALRAFRFFLEKHIEFDTDGDAGHGSLSRHLAADDTVLPLWGAFHDLLLAAAPRLLPDGVAPGWAESWLGKLPAAELGPSLAGQSQQMNGAE